MGAADVIVFEVSRKELEKRQCLSYTNKAAQKCYKEDSKAERTHALCPSSNSHIALQGKIADQ